jgi:cytochrome subunit of sulfide dehydrogenase
MTMTIHNLVRALLLVGSNTALALAAQAQDPAALQLRGLAATCANCHGTGGHAIAGAAIPGLAGMPAPYLTAQMKSFKDGSRSATLMHQIAKGYNETQIEQLAAYFAAQPK